MAKGCCLPWRKSSATLREGGVTIVALHNHMVGELPAFYFTHFEAMSGG